MIRWTATLAPLDSPAGDGRIFSKEFTLTAVPASLPLLMDEPDALIGVIENAEVLGPLILARGVVTDPKIAARMARGDLRPEMQLSDPEVGADGEFLSAALRAIRAGTSPLWPVCAFIIHTRPTVYGIRGHQIFTADEDAQARRLAEQMPPATDLT